MEKRSGDELLVDAGTLRHIDSDVIDSIISAVEPKIKAIETLLNAFKSELELLKNSIPRHFANEKRGTVRSKVQNIEDAEKKAELQGLLDKHYTQERCRKFRNDSNTRGPLSKRFVWMELIRHDLGQVSNNFKWMNNLLKNLQAAKSSDERNRTGALKALDKLYYEVLKVLKEGGFRDESADSTLAAERTMFVSQFLNDLYLEIFPSFITKILTSLQPIITITGEGDKVCNPVSKYEIEEITVDNLSQFFGDKKEIPAKTSSKKPSRKKRNALRKLAMEQAKQGDQNHQHRNDRPKQGARKEELTKPRSVNDEHREKETGDIAESEQLGLDIDEAEYDDHAEASEEHHEPIQQTTNTNKKQTPVRRKSKAQRIMGYVGQQHADTHSPKRIPGRNQRTQNLSTTTSQSTRTPVYLSRQAHEVFAMMSDSRYPTEVSKLDYQNLIKAFIEANLGPGKYLKKVESLKKRDQEAGSGQEQSISFGDGLSLLVTRYDGIVARLHLHYCHGRDAGNNKISKSYRREYMTVFETFELAPDDVQIQ